MIRGCKLAIKYLSKENGGKGGLIVNVGSTAGKNVFTLELIFKICMKRV